MFAGIEIWWAKRGPQILKVHVGLAPWLLVVGCPDIAALILKVITICFYISLK